MTEPQKPYLAQAQDAFRAGDRRGAAALIVRELEEGRTPAKYLPAVQRLAMRIGEVELAIRAAQTGLDASSLPSLLDYWSMLAASDRGKQVLAEIAQLTPAAQDVPAVLHLRGVLAAERGKRSEAEELFRRALAKAPGSLHSWGALAALKTFREGDPDLDAMEAALDAPGAPETARASLLYGLGKAYEDLEDFDRAFEYYAQGAALRRAGTAFDIAKFRAAVERTMAEYTPANLERLKPSTVEGTRSLFVTGMPRSGTTLVEQLLVAHPLIAAGGELNLFGAVALPAAGPIEKAFAYQENHGEGDPWGLIATDYSNLVDMHFETQAPVVDKTLGESVLTGLLLHTMPDARIAWLRRDPEDVALSCFTTNFATGLNWTWSFDDIAEMMKIEDALFAHWTSLFPDRILEVPYEDVVADPSAWSEKLQRHFNLPVEGGLAEAMPSNRPVRTASQLQVREPISDRRIGRSKKFAKHLAPFRKRYAR